MDYVGRVWEARSLAYEGAHVAGQNERNLGVMLLGNYEQQAPSVTQITSLEAVVQALRERYGIKRHRVYGHRDLGQSVCLGAHLYPHVEKLKQ